MRHFAKNSNVSYPSAAQASLNHATDYPWSAMTYLSALLMPHADIAQPTRISRGKRQYHFLAKDIALLYLITDGVFHERIEGSERVLNTWFAPAIIGWAEPDKRDNHYYLERQGAGSVSAIPVAQAYDIVAQNNAMLDVVRIMSYYLNQREKTNTAIQDTAYDIVKNMIDQFVRLPVWYQQQTSLIQFISQRTALGKSSIMRILKILRDGYFIEMDNGRLLTTCQLPDTLP